MGDIAAERRGLYSNPPSPPLLHGCVGTLLTASYIVVASCLRLKHAMQIISAARQGGFEGPCLLVPTAHQQTKVVSRASTGRLVIGMANTDSPGPQASLRV